MPYCLDQRATTNTTYTPTYSISQYPPLYFISPISLQCMLDELYQQD